MTGPMKSTPRPTTRRGYALVLSLFLIGLLAASSGGLAMLTATESIRSAWVARDLDHRLAVESLMACLPDLLAKPNDAPTDIENKTNERVLRLTLGDCAVMCRVTPEAGKLNMSAGSQARDASDQLRALGQTNGLPPEHVQFTPIVDSQKTRGWPKALWFDQVVRAHDIDEMFPWPVDNPAVKPKSPKPSWSDHLSFWPAAQGQTWSLLVTTSIEADRRRWYVVATIVDGRAHPLYLGAL